MKNLRQHPDSVFSLVRKRIRGKGRGAVVVPKDFLGLGSRQAVDAAFGRLAGGGELRRIARGLYDYPKTHPIFGLRTPSADDVAHAIARSTGESICHCGAKAASALGVSTQVPAQALYLTDGTSRAIRVDLGNGRGFVVRFKRSTHRHGGDTKAGLVLRALSFLGRDGVDDGTLRTLKAALSKRDLKKLMGLQRHARGWMQPMLAQILLDGEKPGVEAA